MTTHGLGWIHPKTQGKKHVGKRTAAADPAVSTPSMDLSPDFPLIWDQSHHGSCVAQATGSCTAYACPRSGWPMETPSRFHIYYRAREAIGTQSWDSGCLCSDALEALATSGWIEERDWPYTDDRVTVKPPDSILGPADHRRLIDYEALDWDAASIRWELASGNPVVFGAVIYKSFSAVGIDGMIPDPGGEELGGHAMVVVGYDAARKLYRIRNSWGLGWGDWGYGWMSESYLTSPFEVGELFAVRSVRVRP